MPIETGKERFPRMRLAVLADIHGNLPALEAVVLDFRRRGVDAVVSLGDSVSGPLLPRETSHGTGPIGPTL